MGRRIKTPSRRFRQRCETHCDALCRNTLKHTLPQHTATHFAAMLCNILQHAAAHCSTLQHTATRRRAVEQRHNQGDAGKGARDTLQHTLLQRTATRCDTLQDFGRPSNTDIIKAKVHNTVQRTLPQRTATHCRTLQHTATHCYTLQLVDRPSKIDTINTIQAKVRNTLQHIVTHLQYTATH